MKKDVAKETFSESEKILLWIATNEPVNSFATLIDGSGMKPDRVKMNIERLHNAKLLSGHLIHDLGYNYFTQAVGIKLSYDGVKELKQLQENGKLINGIEVSFGVLKFNVNL